MKHDPILAVMHAETKRRAHGMPSIPLSLSDYCRDGRSIPRIARELAELGVAVTTTEQYAAHRQSAVACTEVTIDDSTWTRWAESVAQEPDWTRAEPINGSQSPEEALSVAGASPAHLAWAVLHADRLEWMVRQHGQYRVAPIGACKRSEEMWAERYFRTAAMGRAQRAVAHEARVNAVVRENLGDILIEMGLLAAGEEEALLGPVGGHYRSDRMASWVAPDAAAHCREVVETLRAQAAEAERRAAILARLERAVQQRGGWESVQADMRQLVEAEMAKSEGAAA